MAIQSASRPTVTAMPPSHTYSDINALVMVPSVVAVTVGATQLIKREAPRDVD